MRRISPQQKEQRRADPLLCVDAAVDLVPIDHGYCLPDRPDAPFFEWLHWPQAALPFSAQELDYIASLSADRDVLTLRKALPALRRRGCLRVLRLSTALLQRGAALGLCAADIGAVMSRDVQGGEERASELEMACVEALGAVQAGGVAVKRSGMSMMYQCTFGGEGRWEEGSESDCEGPESVPEVGEEEEDSEEEGSDEGSCEEESDDSEQGVDGAALQGRLSSGSRVSSLTSLAVDESLDLQQALVLGQLRLLQREKTWAGRTAAKQSGTESGGGMMFQFQLDDDAYASPTLTAANGTSTSADGPHLKSPSSPLLLASTSGSHSSKSSPFISSSPDDLLPPHGSLLELSLGAQGADKAGRKPQEEGEQAGLPGSCAAGGSAAACAPDQVSAGQMAVANALLNRCAKPMNVSQGPGSGSAGSAKPCLAPAATGLLASASFKDCSQRRMKPKNGHCPASKRAISASSSMASLPGEEAAALLAKLPRLSDQEWSLFLEAFDPLLENALQRRKKDGSGCRVRFGTSCRF